jgi:hypothetical protein
MEALSDITSLAGVSGLYADTEAARIAETEAAIPVREGGASVFGVGTTRSVFGALRALAEADDGPGVGSAGKAESSSVSALLVISAGLIGAFPLMSRAGVSTVAVFSATGVS